MKFVLTEKGSWSCANGAGRRTNVFLVFSANIIYISFYKLIPRFNFRLFNKDGHFESSRFHLISSRFSLSLSLSPPPPLYFFTFSLFFLLCKLAILLMKLNISERNAFFKCFYFFLLVCFLFFFNFFTRIYNSNCL